MPNAGPKRIISLTRAVATLLLLAGGALMVDLPVARWCFEHRDWATPWDDLYEVIMLSEIFGHLWGACLAVVAIFVLDPEKRHKLWRFILILCVSGVAPNLIKLLFIRYRPRFFFSGDFPGDTDTVLQTFGGFQTLSAWDLAGKYLSFPSGHSCLACGTAVALTWLYPRGKCLFAALVALVMLQRVVCSAHFPSDTFAGAAIGLLVASLCLPKETS